MAHEYVINSEGDSVRSFKNLHLPGRPSHLCYDVNVDVCNHRNDVESITDSTPDIGKQHNHRLMIPSLCHPHIHLDKCFLLSHPKYADLEIQKGDFSEAIQLTSLSSLYMLTLTTITFSLFTLRSRGRALIEESIQFGVTHMRAFVEVDFGVEMKCVDAGLALKEEFRDKCYVQICVFAQDPILSHDHGSRSMPDSLEKAIQRPGVEVLGSTPYVEKSLGLREENMKWTIETAKPHQVHLDFHLDYHLNEGQKPMIYSAIERLHRANWTANSEYKEFRTVVFGHCTRLALLDENEWHKLRPEIRDLPIEFCHFRYQGAIRLQSSKVDPGSGA
ncbi:hypothetical protein DSL72_005718 [Monilinia vaccinii-corymbosi]|uniref:Amidohydrolase-related domain-containing protein n=1 Tax=Monilinia vaccinii-corymbosi TaxID=61207 RepID=A0A8A3PGD8_9HELO|nr:hypothetical protein DSL72_005718 [Monilinia vaccinii-corymbosi]